MLGERFVQNLLRVDRDLVAFIILETHTASAARQQKRISPHIGG